MTDEVDQKVPITGQRRRPRTAIPDGQTFDATLTSLPPFSQGGEEVSRGTPSQPKIRDNPYILILTKNGSIKLPKTRARGNGIRDRNRKQNSTMIRERTRKNITRRYRRHPDIWNPKKVNTRSQRAVPPGPSETRG